MVTGERLECSRALPGNHTTGSSIPNVASEQTSGGIRERQAGDGMGEGSGMRSRDDKRRLATGGRIGMKGESLILPKV